MRAQHRSFGLLLSAAMLAGSAGFAFAAAPDTARKGLSFQDCYRRSASCTTFCGQIKDQDWRYECFATCDTYLDNCLDRGDWTDQSNAERAVGPMSSATPEAHIRMIVLLADADGDGALSIEEMRAVQDRAFKQADTNGDGKVSVEEIAAFLALLQGGEPAAEPDAGETAPRQTAPQQPAPPQPTAP